MSASALTLEAVKEQFCTVDKKEALIKIREGLDDEWDIEQAAELTVEIGKKMEADTAANGLTWAPAERLLWTVKEAFILGCLDMAAKMMIVNDMGYEALEEMAEQMDAGGEVKEHG